MGVGLVELNSEWPIMKSTGFIKLKKYRLNLLKSRFLDMATIIKRGL